MLVELGWVVSGSCPPSPSGLTVLGAAASSPFPAGNTAGVLVLTSEKKMNSSVFILYCMFQVRSVCLCNDTGILQSCCEMTVQINPGQNSTCSL